MQETKSKKSSYGHRAQGIRSGPSGSRLVVASTDGVHSSVTCKVRSSVTCKVRIAITGAVLRVSDVRGVLVAIPRQLHRLVFCEEVGRSPGSSMAVPRVFGAPLGDRRGIDVAILVDGVLALNLSVAVASQLAVLD